MQCNACMYVCECVWLFSFWSNFLFHIGLLRADITGFKATGSQTSINTQLLGIPLQFRWPKLKSHGAVGQPFFQTDPFWIWGSVLQILANCFIGKTLNSLLKVTSWQLTSGALGWFRSVSECSYLHHILRLPATKHAWYSGLECHGLGLKLTVVGKNMKQVETGALRTCLQCQWYDCLNKWKKQMATTTMF